MSPVDMNRRPSEDPTVHRELVVVDEPMLGRDVGNLNRATHARLKARGLTDDVSSPTHDKFTLAAALAAIEASHWLGARSDTYLRTDKGRRVCTEGLQQMIREPDERTDEQLERAKVRRARLKDGPAVYDKLAKEAGATGKGVQSALRFAAAQVGTTESPAGSNDGPKIRQWWQICGYGSPVPWCGCFVNAVIIAGGCENGKGWAIGYTPAIVAHAKAGRGGWSWHEDGKPGDLALFDTPGGPTAVHVGIVERRMGGGTYQTVEGNTSSGDGGSQSNGGGVFRRQRSTVGNFRIVGFARPPWPT